MVGNKCDIVNAAITREEGQVMAERFKVEYIETSAAEDINIEEMMQKIM